MPTKVWKSDDFIISKYPVVDEYTDFDAERLIVIGDVHGCIVELAALLKSINPGPKDRIVFVGDLIDRGPASIEVAETVRELCLTRPRTHCVLGNHEEKHVRYRKWRHVNAETGKKSPMKLVGRNTEVQDGLSDEVLAWMAGLPAVVSIMKGHTLHTVSMTFITHAGFLPQNSFRQETSGLIRNRYLKQSPDGGRWSPAGMGPGFVQKPDTVEWSEVWRGPRVIYGHIVHSLNGIANVNDCWGIDTGVCFGGHLSAYVEDLRTGEVDINQVKAEKVYFKDDGEDQ